MKVELKVRADGALTPIYANLHTLIIIMFVRTALTATAPRMKQGYQRNHKQYFFSHNCYKNAWTQQCLHWQIWFWLTDPVWRLESVRLCGQKFGGYPQFLLGTYCVMRFLVFMRCCLRKPTKGVERKYYRQIVIYGGMQRISSFTIRFLGWMI